MVSLSTASSNHCQPVTWASRSCHELLSLYWVCVLSTSQGCTPEKFTLPLFGKLMSAKLLDQTWVCSPSCPRFSFFGPYCQPLVLPGGSVGKNPPANAGDVGSVLGSGRSPGAVNGNLLQYSCLGNPMDRRARWALCPWGRTRVGHDRATKQQFSVSMVFMSKQS